MHPLEIRLFGWPQITCGGHPIEECRSSKVKELLCYLLLHRNRLVSRESVASLLSNGNGTTGRSKKYLRNALWKLRIALDHLDDLNSADILEVDRDWIELRTSSKVWLDVDVFEQAWKTVTGVSGADFTETMVKRTAEAVDLYSAPLLSDWDMDWCERERDRLHEEYLRLLDKLAEYHEAIDNFEIALQYGEQILNWDKAHERTHRRVMRVYLKLGDRTKALRQYDQCRNALREELETRPGPETVDLFERIRRGDSRSYIAV